MTYGYAYWKDAETWEGGSFTTREEAAAAAFAEEPEAPCCFTVEAIHLGPRELAVLAAEVSDWWLENLDEHLCETDEWGWADDPIIPYSKQDLIKAFGEAIGRAVEDFFTAHPEGYRPMWRFTQASIQKHPNPRTPDVQAEPTDPV